MMRVLILVLLLANLGFYAWTQGWLDPVTGVRAMGDREPERLARQVSPENIRILPPQAQPGQGSQTAERLCLEAGPFVPAQVPAAQAVLQAALPAGSWAVVSNELSAVWTVYMGRFANRDAVLKKIEELDRLKVPFQEIAGASELAPGVSLGRFADAASAGKALAEFIQRGVRTARVAELAPARTEVKLRVEQADAALQGQLAGLRDEALLGKTFAACDVAAAR